MNESKTLVNLNTIPNRGILTDQEAYEIATSRTDNSDNELSYRRFREYSFELLDFLIEETEALYAQEIISRLTWRTYERKIEELKTMIDMLEHALPKPQYDLAGFKQ